MDLSGEIGLVYLRHFISNKYTHTDKKEGITYMLSKLTQSPHSVLDFAIQEKAPDEILVLLFNHPHMNLMKIGNLFDGKTANYFTYCRAFN